jgi:tetratricopeptide (TPR) repeat protein
MQLYAALGTCLLHMEGPLPRTHGAWSHVLDIAESLGDQAYQMRALSGLWEHHILRGERRAAESFATRFSSLAQIHGDPSDSLAIDRMVGILHHLLGDQPSARDHIEQVLQCLNNGTHPAYSVDYLIDERVAARAVLARILWLQGYPEQAINVAEDSERIARSIQHNVSLCFSLANSVCPVAVWEGDLSRANRAVETLLERSSTDSLQTWNALGRCLKGVVLIEGSKIGQGLQILGRTINARPDIGEVRQYPLFLGEFGKGLGRVGKSSQGIDAINEALDLSERNGLCWYRAELLRAHGELILLENGHEADTKAEEAFKSALKLAGKQGVLSLELRSAMSLYRLKKKQGGGGDAWSCLNSISELRT